MFMRPSVKIMKLPHSSGSDLLSLDLPFYATAQSAGMDLLAAITTPVTIRPNSTFIVPTGIAIGLPSGFEAQIRPRSGLAAKFGITVLNTPGTIDADYRGEIQVILINHSANDFIVERGMRIAQMVIARYEHVVLEEVDSLDETVRGAKGFGSTGH